MLLPVILNKAFFAAVAMPSFKPTRCQGHELAIISFSFVEMHQNATNLTFTIFKIVSKNASHLLF